MSTGKPYPGIGSAILLVILVQVVANAVAIMILVAFVVAKGVPVDPFAIESMNPAAMGIVANSLAFGSIIWLGWSRTKRPARQVFPFRKVAFPAWFPMILTMAGALLVVNEITNLMVEYLPPWDWVKDLFGNFLGRGTGVAGFVFLVIVAPITEELLFRGVMLNGFVPRYGKAKAVIASAALFGAIHLIPWQVVPAFLLGLVFAWWTVQTGSLWPALIAHALTNGFAFQQGLTQDPAEIFAVTPQPFWLTALGVALLAAGLSWGVRVMSGIGEHDRLSHPPGVGPGFLEDQE